MTLQQLPQCYPYWIINTLWSQIFMVSVSKIYHHTDKPGGMGSRPITRTRSAAILMISPTASPSPSFVCATLPRMQIPMHLRYDLSFLCDQEIWSDGPENSTYALIKHMSEKSLRGTKHLIADSAELAVECDTSRAISRTVCLNSHLVKVNIPLKAVLTALLCVRV